MGNTIAIEDIKFEKEQIVAKSTTPSECAAIRVYYYEHLTSQGVPHSEASGRAYSVYFQCMGRVISIQE